MEKMRTVPERVLVEAWRSLRDADDFTNIVARLSKSDILQEASYSIHGKVSSAADDILEALNRENIGI